MLEIPRPHTIVHPRTMMIHFGDAAIANATMVTAGWFEGLTLTAHAEFCCEGIETLLLGRNGTGWHTARIRQGGFHVGRQGEGRQERIQNTGPRWNTTGPGQQCHGHGTVRHEEPHQTTHNGTSGIGTIQPNPIVVRSTRRARVGHVVKVVNVVQSIVALLCVVNQTAKTFAVTSSMIPTTQCSTCRVPILSYTPRFFLFHSTHGLGTPASASNGMQPRWSRLWRIPTSAYTSRSFLHGL
jgi:hypothetical protein